ncbi:MAG: Non-specific serine/threonine protein kinase [Candidatus Gottesmanbacteria bacterium GW2011_GWB1_49_7]|uniref:Non-specific serine/threonine protein kinase n=1 Tax=Candidatus Gottesmanbacteria bacterium GW2011_GWB1_49_7 TaxID=1618448 RepID=A0A0G1W3K1_9BACT|nr:MAG: Non-specific serine/threonine protein kinase [Candidatus Gottesmanbacteria bacterium GW2011_GWB1_49_7]
MVPVHIKDSEEAQVAREKLYLQHLDSVVFVPPPVKKSVWGWLIKSTIHGHWMTTRSGKRVWVKEHSDKRVKHAPQAALLDVSPTAKPSGKERAAQPSATPVKPRPLSLWDVVEAPGTAPKKPEVKPEPAPQAREEEPASPTDQVYALLKQPGLISMSDLAKEIGSLDTVYRAFAELKARGTPAYHHGDALFSLEPPSKSGRRKVKKGLWGWTFTLPRTLYKAHPPVQHTGEKVPVKQLDPALRKKVSTGTHFTSDEMKKHGLVWRTTEDGRHIIVKDLGNDEGVVVGGAEGKMNFARIKLKGGSSAEAKPLKEKKTTPELTEKEHTEAEEKQRAMVSRKQELKQQARDLVRNKIAAVGQLDLDEKQLQKVRDLAKDKAKAQGVFGEAADEFVKHTEQQFQADHATALRKIQQEALDRALKKHAREHQTGVKHEAEAITAEEVAEHAAKPREGKEEATPDDMVAYLKELLPEKLQLSDEESQQLVSSFIEERELDAQARTLRRALKRGEAEGIRAVDLATRALTPEEMRQYASEMQVRKEEVLTNLQLVQAAEAVPKSIRQEQLHHGLADTAAGLGYELLGETLMDTTSVRKLGAAASSRLVAQSILDRYGGNARKAAAAVREYVAQHSSAVAAAAMQRHDDLLQRAGEFEQFAGKNASSLLTAQQARAYALQYTNEAKRVVARSLGSLEMASSVAELLSQGPITDPLSLRGRGTLVGTHEMAGEMGLSKGDYTVQKEQRHYNLQVKPEAMSKLVKRRKVESLERDREVQRIKDLGQQSENLDPATGREYRAPGQQGNIMLSAPQAADIQMWERQKKILVTDEAGLGKTAVAILGATNLVEQGLAKKVLVVVPLSVQQQFSGEIEKFADPKYHDSYTVADSRDKMRKAGKGDQVFTIVTRDALRNWEGDIKEGGFDAVVVDEAHEFTIRGEASGSGRSQALRRVLPDMEYALLMTGTPVKNDLTELHSLVDSLQPGALGSLAKFKERYGGLERRRGLFDQSLLNQLQHELDGVVVGHSLHVEKDGSLVIENAKNRSGNPVELKEQTLYVDPTEAQTQQIAENNEMYLTAKRAGVAGVSLAKHGLDKKAVNNISAEANSKSQPVASWLQEKGYPQRKAIVFSDSPEVIRSTILPAMGVDPKDAVIIEGDVSESWQRDAIARWYNEDEGKPLDERQRRWIERQGWAVNKPPRMLFATDAANYGMNLPGGSLMVEWDTTDTAATSRQRIGREWRTGQNAATVDVLHVRTRTPHEMRAEDRLKNKAASMKIGEETRHVDESGFAPIVAAHLGKLKEEGYGD